MKLKTFKEVKVGDLLWSVNEYDWKEHRNKVVNIKNNADGSIDFALKRSDGKLWICIIGDWAVNMSSKHFFTYMNGKDINSYISTNKDFESAVH